jgi:hypothetical protein
LKISNPVFGPVATAQGHFQQVEPLKSRLSLGIPTEAVMSSRRLARSFLALGGSHDSDGPDSIAC